MSRPEKEIDWKKVDQLLMAGCCGTEIAPHFDMHYETFYRRVMEKYGVGFTEYSAYKRQQGLSLIRAKQFEKALEKDNTMLIWLGKVDLKQKDQSIEYIMPNDVKIDEKISQFDKDKQILNLQKENESLKEKLGLQQQAIPINPGSSETI